MRPNKERLAQWLEELEASIIPNEKIEIITEMILSVLKGFTIGEASYHSFRSLPGLTEGGYLIVDFMNVVYVKSTPGGSIVIDTRTEKMENKSLLDTTLSVKQVCKAIKTEFYEYLVVVSDDLAVNVNKITNYHPEKHSITLLDSNTFILSPEEWKIFSRNWKKLERG